ncbi:hypothetical protein [Acinetobacter sp. SWBY1]|uniref:hypothetical protein n=1 Tax=Acinetobacter sp. SWBY1 TaxID=2079596 RepID=UPI000CF2024F|nr:hypothetical protein [Acinetobacter sp. SWBY1]AVH48640.1 hypothetical protein C3Y93_02830 [Acinetobacter sp. SWBY1]
MVASTDIKFYVHTNNNAPQLQNAYGSMISVLDACLINGFQIGVVSSLTASGNIVTATFGAAHNLMQYQVIKITGANQPEFNGEHRILTIPNSSSLTFELATAPSVPTATGAISASLPPLGWEKPFSSTHSSGVGGKAAYRSLNLLLPSRPFLRVVDELDPAYTATYAKFAKVGIVEDMTDINTMLGVQAPFDITLPNKNWVGTGSGATAYNGWSKWIYARSAASSATEADLVANGVRKWFLVGNSDYFYVVPAFAVSSNVGPIYGFGNFVSNIPSDSTNTFLSATNKYTPANSSYYVGENSGIGSNSSRNANIILLRKFDQSALFATASNGILQIGSSPSATTGASNDINAVDVLGYIQSFDVFLTENKSAFSAAVGLVRGKLSGIRWLLQNKPLSEYELIELGDEVYIGKSMLSHTIDGQMLFKVV